MKETLKLVFDISCYSSIGNMYLPAVSLSSDVFDKNGPFHSNRMFVGGVAEKWRQKRGTFFWRRRNSGKTPVCRSRVRSKKSVACTLPCLVGAGAPDLLDCVSLICTALGQPLCCQCLHFCCQGREFVNENGEKFTP